MALGSAVGWGAFILPFDWLNSAGLGGIFLGFLIGSIMILTIAYSYGAVIRALPVTGGGVAFALAALGRTHGFIAGWCLTLGYACIVALNASAVTLVFRVTLPDMVMQMKLYEVAGWDVYLPEVIIASLFLIAFALINIRGIEFSGRFQYIAVVIMLVGVVLVLIATSIYFLLERHTLPPAFPSDVSPWAAAAVIIAFAPWAYVGFDSVPQLAGEFNFSPRKATGLIVGAVLGATFIYVAMSVSTAFAAGTNWAIYEADVWPTATAIASVTGPLGMILMVISVSMGVLTGLNGFYAATSRVLLTMGRASMIPRAFANLHPKWSTPAVAIVFTTALCLITPWFGRAALSWVVDMTSVGITVAYFYTCHCSYRIGRTGSVWGMQIAVTPNQLQKWMGIAGCILAFGFLLLLLVPGSPGFLSTPSLIALITWFAAGAGFYFLRRREIFAIDSRELKNVVFQR